MKIRKLLCRKKKGFTLVECVVAMGVFAVMAAMIMQMLAISIMKYRVNHNLQQDMDKQISDIISENALVERETMDFAMRFILSGGTGSGINVNINDVKVNKAPAGEGDNRLEINNFEGEIEAPDDDGSNNDVGGAGMVKDTDHVYGTKGIKRIYIDSVESENAENGNKVITLGITIYDNDKVLAGSESSSVKISLPKSAVEVSFPNADNRLKPTILSGNTFRVYLASPNNSAESYNKVEVRFELTPEDYEDDYESFAQFFMGRTGTDSSVTFYENPEVPGVYNLTSPVLGV